MYAIEIDSLSETFRRRGRSDIHAVRDLSLSVPPGQVFGFLGPNGAGKTTTIKMTCGLIAPPRAPCGSAATTWSASAAER